MLHRVDIISDTHGYLSGELLEALEGAELIVHAGDCCSRADYEVLGKFAPVQMCLGNNDWNYSYGPDVVKDVRFFRFGTRWQICHYEELLDTATCDIAVCGHTHRPVLERQGSCLVVNPGSTTFPRNQEGATMARLMVGDDGAIESACVLTLDDGETLIAEPGQRQAGTGGFWRGFF